MCKDERVNFWNNLLSSRCKDSQESIQQHQHRDMFMGYSSESQSGVQGKGTAGGVKACLQNNYTEKEILNMICFVFVFVCIYKFQLFQNDKGSFGIVTYLLSVVSLLPWHWYFVLKWYGKVSH